MEIIAYLYLFFLVFFGVIFGLTPIIEKNLDNCHPLKKWWRKHIIDYDPSEPRPEGTNCDE